MFKSQVGNQVLRRVGLSCREIGDQVWWQALQQVQHQVEDQVHWQVRLQVAHQLDDQVRDRDQVTIQVGRQLDDQVRDQLAQDWNMIWSRLS